MIAKIVKVTKKKSQYGGSFYYVNFRDLQNRTYCSYIYERMRNFDRWKKILDVGITLSGLKTVKGRGKIIDADSKFQIVEEK